MAEADTAKVLDLVRKVEALDQEKVELVKENEEVKKELEEMKLHVGKLMREKEVMKEGFLVEIDEVRKAKGVVEAKVGELESKVQGIEEEAKGELLVKEREISFLNKKVAEWEAAEKAEKKVLEDALNVSEAKVGELETKLIQLQKKVEEAERVISGLKDATAEAVNGMEDTDAVLAFEGSNKRTINLQWAVGAGASAVVVGGIICLHYARRR